MRSFILLLLLLAAQSLSAQYDWNRFTYYHSDGQASMGPPDSYQIEIWETGASKLEFTKYGRTNIYDFTASPADLNKIDKMIASSGILDADTMDLRGDKEFKAGPVYLMTLFLDKPEGSKKRKNPVIIVQTDVSDKYREKAFRIYEEIEGAVPKSTWEQALADAEKNKPE